MGEIGKIMLYEVMKGDFMIKEIGIKNFRGIKDISLKDFSKINIFVGKANMRKTSILEALYLYLSDHPESITDILEFRGIVSDEDCFQSFFYDYNLQEMIVLNEGKREIKIHSCNDIYTNILVDNSQQKHQENIEITFNDMSIKGINTIIFDYSNNEIIERIKISRKQANPFQMQFQNELKLKLNKAQKALHKKAEFICEDNAYNKTLRNNVKDIFLSARKRRDLMEKIRNFFNDIEDITMLGNKIVVQKEGLDTLLNLRLMGSGFQKIFAIILSVLKNRKYILIDEIENGLHFKDINSLLQIILDDDTKAQFFITTHNEEILKHLNSLLENKGTENLVSIFKVYEDAKQNIKTGRYSQENFIFNTNHNNEMRD
ncbi:MULTISPECIES: AAA family ATPase [Helicobacter]|nr:MULTISPECIES: AAA family ATPase [Helicobacter]